jgi:DNA polymerase-3 subunit delta'
MWNIIGHQQTLTFFEHARSSGHLAHAYLLTGPAQVGKRTLALAFGQALLCIKDATPPGSPCGTCQACVKVQNGVHPDLRVIRPAEGKKTLGIDEIRELIGAAALQPQEGRYSIFILPRAEMLTNEAANAFLKTLEEPAPQTILFLTATDDQLLPATIISRCQVLPLGLVNTHEISAALIERWTASQEQAQELSVLAAGRPGWAIAASQNPELQEQRAAWFALMETLCVSGPAQRMKIGATLARDTEQLDELLMVWLSWWREALFFLEGASSSEGQRGTHLNQYARQLRPETARQVIRQIQEAAQQLEQNAQPRLVVETLLLQLPQIKDSSGHVSRT